MDLATFVLGLLLSLAAAVIPTALWTTLVWLCDRYEREPIPLVTAAFLWGAVPAVGLALLAESFWSGPAGLGGAGISGEILSDSGLVPVIEELAKGAALVLILVLWPSEIDDMLDGILYGAVVGFGFAMTENFLYFMSALSQDGWGSWVGTVFLRGLVFGLNHAFFTAFFGASVGYARVARYRWQRYLAPAGGLVAGSLAHGIHNLGATLTSVAAAGVVISLVNDAGGVLLVAAMIGLALRQERQWIRSELADEVDRRVSREEYGEMLTLRGRWAMLVRAARAGGLSGLTAMGNYQQLATELAFRKHRARMLGPDAGLSREIADLGGRVERARARAVPGSAG